MLVFGDIDAHDQMLLRSANKAAKLTKLFEPANVIQNNLLCILVFLIMLPLC
jgi:hypothetical protein